jgi:hypothetical protein
MNKPIGRDTIYRCRRFSAETIELCVRWYITYRLSYRDLAAMMAERDRNGCVCPWRSALPISSGGQERKIRWVAALQ